MQRGNLISLSLAALLFTSFLLPHPAEGFINYYNEKGRLIRQYEADTSRTFIIKTSKTRFDIYSVNDSTEVGTATVNGIAVTTAIAVESLIEKGMINDELVRDNTVEVFNDPVFREMRARIRDTETGGRDSVNNKEYGGLLYSSGQIFYVDSGRYDALCEARKRAIRLPQRGVAEFHDHPSGCKGDLPFYPCADTALAKEPKICGHVQGPSRVDQQEVGRRTGYVFAMRARIVFIYDSKGIKATLPFSFFEQHR
jgi:hypothetical protein